MYDYEDDRNQVRINLTNLKNAIDSEKQDTDRLIQDLKDEDARKANRIIELSRELTLARNRYFEKLEGFVETMILISCSVIIVAVLGAWIYL